MRANSFCLALVTMFVCACAPTQVKPSIEFDESSFVAALAPGSETITGQGFLRTTIGEVRYAAGSIVHLYPMTRYIEECAKLMAQNTWHQQAVCDQRVQTLARQTQADGEGRFTFTGVLPGTYYVETSVIWSVPQGLFYSTQEGGFVGAKVTVEPGRPANVILNR